MPLQPGSTSAIPRSNFPETRCHHTLRDLCGCAGLGSGDSVIRTSVHALDQCQDTVCTAILVDLGLVLVVILQALKARKISAPKFGWVDRLCLSAVRNLTQPTISCDNLDSRFRHILNGLLNPVVCGHAIVPFFIATFGHNHLRIIPGGARRLAPTAVEDKNTPRTSNARQLCCHLLSALCHLPVCHQVGAVNEQDPVSGQICPAHLRFDRSA
mmetsp:Transcript_7078/g.18316  ORF Transcript_7078/g.18316 Transcript_7078/m.18316 type:complete len:213 (+) Transcript_7078:155-793(+)